MRRALATILAFALLANNAWGQAPGGVPYRPVIPGITKPFNGQLTGTLPPFQTTPLVNLGDLGGAATAAGQTAIANLLASQATAARQDQANGGALTIAARCYITYLWFEENIN